MRHLETAYAAGSASNSAATSKAAGSRCTRPSTPSQPTSHGPGSGHDGTPGGVIHTNRACRTLPQYRCCTTSTATGRTGRASGQTQARRRRYSRAGVVVVSNTVSPYSASSISSSWMNVAALTSTTRTSGRSSWRCCSSLSSSRVRRASIPGRKGSSSSTTPTAGPAPRAEAVRGHAETSMRQAPVGSAHTFGCGQYPPASANVRALAQSSVASHSRISVRMRRRDGGCAPGISTLTLSQNSSLDSFRRPASTSAAR